MKKKHCSLYKPSQKCRITKLIRVRLKRKNTKQNYRKIIECMKKKTKIMIFFGI